MDDKYQIIERLLKRVKSQFHLIATLEGLCQTAIALLFFLLSGLFLADILRQSEFLWGTFFLTSGLLLLYLLLNGLFMPWFKLRNHDTVALYIERKIPSFNNNLINSVQLYREVSDSRSRALFSSQLISSLIGQTAEKVSCLDSSELIRKKPLQNKGLLLLSLLSFYSVLVFISPSFFSSSLSHLFTPPSSVLGKGDPGAREGSPLLGDITLKYNFPLYSGFEPKTVPNSSGDVTALRGTEVEIRVKSDREIEQADLAINDQEKIPMEVKGGKLLVGSLTVMEDGNYNFEVTDRWGRKFTDQIKHRISVVPDEYPQMELIRPLDDLEVREKDTVQIRYNATDDFGLKRILLVYHYGNEQNEKEIKFLEDGTRSCSGDYRWNLSELDLRPGHRVSFYLEAEDNDLVSGPKRSKSKVIYLEVFSSQKKHQEIIVLQEQVWEGLIHLLGDHLVNRIEETPDGSRDFLLLQQETLDEKLEQLLKDLDEVVTAMKEDPYTAPGTYNALGPMIGRLRRVNSQKKEAFKQRVIPLSVPNLLSDLLASLQTLQDEEVEELENDIIFLDELIQRQKMEEVVALGDGIVNSQDSLLQLLEDFQNIEDQELLAELSQELDRLEESIRRMMEKLIEISKEIPDEFLNPEAMSDTKQQDLMDSLRKIRESLTKGDLEEARRLAGDLLGALSQLMAALEDSVFQMAMQNYEKALDAIDRSIEELEGLESGERELLRETEGLEKKLRERMGLAEFIEKELKKLARLKKKVEGLTKSNYSSSIRRLLSNISAIEQKLNLLEQTLKHSDLGESLKLAQDSLKKFQMLGRVLSSELKKKKQEEQKLEVVVVSKEVKAATGLNQEIVDDLRSVMELPEGIMEAGEKQQMLEFSLRQKDIKKNTEGFKEKVQKLSQEIPFFPPKFENKLGKACENMGTAMGGLQRMDIPGALPQQRQALHGLESARNSLEQARQQLQEGAGGSALSMPFGLGTPYPGGWYNQGWWGVSQGKVEIPSEEEYQVPKEFRQEILEAMKEKSPKKYQQLNQDYYERLVH
ncbi:MAG: DUF4175 family protein [Deltaproteobacteria bacterium]|nr:MAG: DUF4175 family protein [Deltaproteobacteria bacterium]